MGLLGAATVWLLATVASVASQQRHFLSQDALPDTGFTCADKVPGGYYADPEADCQMFHVCVQGTFVDLQDFRFLCPNGTAFDQEHLVCASWADVSCGGVSGAQMLSALELFKIGVAERELGTPAPPGPAPGPAPNPPPRPRPRRPYEGASNVIRGGEAVEETHYRPLDSPSAQTFRIFSSPPRTTSTSTTTTTSSTSTTTTPPPFFFSQQPLLQSPRPSSSRRTSPALPRVSPSGSTHTTLAPSTNALLRSSAFYPLEPSPTTNFAGATSSSAGASFAPTEATSHRFGSRRRVLVRRPRPSTFPASFPTTFPTTTPAPTSRAPQRRRSRPSSTSASKEDAATTYRPPLPLLLLGFTPGPPTTTTTSASTTTMDTDPTRAPDYDYSYYESDGTHNYNDASDDHFFRKKP